MNGLSEMKTYEALVVVPGTWLVLSISNCQICHCGERQTSVCYTLAHDVSVCWRDRKKSGDVGAQRRQPTCFGDPRSFLEETY